MRYYGIVNLKKERKKMMELKALCSICFMELESHFTSKDIEDAKKTKEPATNKQYLNPCSTKNCNRSGVFLPPSL